MHFHGFFMNFVKIGSRRHFEGNFDTFLRRFAGKWLSQIDSEGSKGVSTHFSAKSTEPFARNTHFYSFLHFFTWISVPLKPGAYRFTCNVVAALQRSGVPRPLANIPGHEEGLAAANREGQREELLRRVKRVLDLRGRRTTARVVELRRPYVARESIGTGFGGGAR